MDFGAKLGCLEIQQKAMLKTTKELYALRGFRRPEHGMSGCLGHFGYKLIFKKR